MEALMLRSGNLLAVRSAAGLTLEEIAAALEDATSFTRRIRNDWRTRRATGAAYRLEREHLGRIMTDDSGVSSLVLPGGLAARVRRTAANRGWVLHEQDLRPPFPAPEINRLELARIRPDQMRVLAALFAADMGVVEAPTAYGKTWLLAQVCRAYPTLSIIVCSYRRDVVQSVFERLGASLPADELGVVSGNRRQEARVLVATTGSLGWARPEQCRLFLYDEVHEAAAPERARKLAHLRQARMFGFSASPRGRSDGSDLVTEALFGPVIHRVTYQEAEEHKTVATISVDVISVGGAAVPYDDDVAQFRYGIWRNALRNCLVSGAAERHYRAGRQTLVMVDKVEHALFLRAHFLRDWPLIHGPTDPEQLRSFRALGLLPTDSWLCTDQQRTERRRQFEHGYLRRAISTGVWSQGVDFRYLAVLIRADGRSSQISNVQIPGRLSRGESGLLVDFSDDFDARFQSRSARRIADYRRKGWIIRQGDSSITKPN